MKVVFLKSYDFPIGGAAQNRLLGIAKGLAYHNVEVEIYQFTPSKHDIEQNSLKSQVIDNVKIFNMAYKYSPIRSKRDQILGILVGVFKTFKAILKSSRKKKIDFIFINNDQNYLLSIFWILAKIIGAKLGRDLNEYPTFILRPNKYSKLEIYTQKHTNYKWFDVCYIISQNLIEYHQTLLKKKCRIMKLPVTVDVDRFEQSIESFPKSNRIVYCGDLSQEKDGVETLIHSFSQILEEFPEMELHLIGKGSEKQTKKILGISEELKLGSKLVLRGFVNSEFIPTELFQARILVLSRPNNTQAKGGFPTKLGEYLMTGVPVCITPVGEIPLFLENEVSAYISKSDSIIDFVEIMGQALRNNAQSIAIGIKGRDVALKHFSHKVQGKMIKDFLKDNL